METEGHWRLLSSVAKAWGEAEPDCILIDNQGQHHLTCRFDYFPPYSYPYLYQFPYLKLLSFHNFYFTRRLVALSCPLLSNLEALTRLDEKVAVTLPASGPVVEGLLKMMAGLLTTSNEGHVLEEV